ncbi:kinase domain protein [Coprinopsis marcescibilis]|uniref:Kinase domain protein n=1 Tax=Coprinopsis marcescibilis TaxID=230819 RepID=A0A5C3KV62_COPMA|nr:kinase domain protein [Coprinopsis marcescibilis]
MALSMFGRWATKAIGIGQPWALRTFSNPHFERIPTGQLLEEETLRDYLATRYYPVRIGEVLASRYQVVGKVGFGATSTVWLARDLIGRRHIALKVFISSSSLHRDEQSRELTAYQRLERGPVSHPGRQAIRTLLDSFIVAGPDGEHQCLVHPPLFDSVYGFLARNPIGRLPTPVLAVVLRQVLRALEYARLCEIIHTDISAANVMFGIDDPSVFEKFEQAEIETPTARKELEDRIIYSSRSLETPHRLGLPVLSDFGAYMSGKELHTSDVQPDIYRSPEVILQVPWSYEIDIWNVGCMILDIFEDRHLFYGTDPEHGVYRSRAHLAEMIALLGPPPPTLLERASARAKFFNGQGVFNAGIEVPPRFTLDQLVTGVEGSDKELFLRFMGKMLQWDPKDRHTAQQLLEDEWLRKHTADA